MTSERRKKFYDEIGRSPHAAALGLKVEEIGVGEARISMPYDRKLIGEPASGVIHGGAVSALMDTTGGASVLSADEGVVATATLDLRIDYMRPATPGQAITAHGVCYHITRLLAFVRITATDEDTAHPVASATGTFTVERED
ncbi:thioesterase [Haematobacter massiliensis]|uniref:Thioesterase n=1 Tax=Haematobacter massiliensis TaxID=195105 RepID=A0A086YAN1_9RHOB|nr:PaaI family thioesterase [Haematobacter massiliensis]KFI31331.1 thioesterase [Haematobacter massiliensis]OWJ73643.1 thioesterase [Haematobacter massiliensis]OWJ87067.1 thioesterase [Haematobacter massiliensis]QBJ23403.1 PaaI family thioesterase [Haematobacter massiliensis]